MACASHSMINFANNSRGFPFQSALKRSQKRRERCNFFTVRASSDESDCNAEECAPDKEVGKVSIEWLAGEKTKVVGTYPPRRKGWTGYVEKDTAGQTNIYSVEPAVYVAENAISSGTAGTSADGAENTAAIAAGLGLISLAAASSILIQVGKNAPPAVQTMEYSGPSLSYYISKFKPVASIEASIPNGPLDSITSESNTEGEVSVESPNVSAGIPQVSVESSSKLEILDSNVSNSS